MSQRVTEAEVIAICGTGLSEEQVSPFLCSASSLVDDALADMGYTSNRLAEIELWLAAHFVAVRDPAVSREKIGETDVQYHGKSDMGLKFTPFGQQVLVLEYKGKFAEIMNSKGPAEMKVIG